jgi:hypothetical protein
MKTNKALRSQVVRDQLARAIKASRNYVRARYPDEPFQRIRGNHSFTLGYFTQAIDNAQEKQ